MFEKKVSRVAFIDIGFSVIVLIIKVCFFLIFLYSKHSTWFKWKLSLFSLLVPLKFFIEELLLTPKEHRQTWEW